MASWAEFEHTAPALAGLGMERWARQGLFLLGTLRKDGSVRISPCEYILHDGQIWTGMMWQSKKALDLERAPRVTIHNAVTGKDGKDGEFKVYGRAVTVRDVSRRKAYGALCLASMGWEPSEPYHLFTID